MRRMPLISILVILAWFGPPIIAHNQQEFDLVEATIADILRAYRSDLLEPAQLVQMYLNRIATYDPQLNSYVHVSDHAVDDALALDDDGPDDDRDNFNKPLWGVPIILKDNINTADMPTTAGSVALGGSIPPYDATVTRKLRRAGAIILGKATLTEFAGALAPGLPEGFSSQLRFQLGGEPGDPLLGYSFNPYDPRRDPRDAPFDDGRPALTPGGSSSGPGIAVSANLAAAGIGTETSGSIICPASRNLLVGIKPTVGLVSRYGIVPFTKDQDTAGPIARTVADAARVLGVIAGYDPHDPATAACLTPGNCYKNYRQFLNRHALRGVYIGVPYFSYWTDANGNPNLGDTQRLLMSGAIHVLRQLGARVEFTDVPDQAEFNAFPVCPAMSGPCSSVWIFGIKRDVNAYLATLGTEMTIADIIAYNNAHASIALKYGQRNLLAAGALDITPGSDDELKYEADRAYDIDLSRTRGLDVLHQQFDALLFPACSGRMITGRAGYPSIVVPGGFVDNAPSPPFPPDFNAKEQPYGVAFSGPAFSEPNLIGYAYAFEQATHHRQPPDSTPPLPGDVIVR